MKIGKKSVGLLVGAAFGAGTLSLVTVSMSLAGGETGGGGNGYAAHFSGVGSRISKVYKRLCPEAEVDSSPLCKASPEFASAVKGAKVLPRDQVLGSDGKPREAGPDGRGNIEVNVPLYKASLNDTKVAERTVRLVTHEYMIVAGVETLDNYDTTNLVINSFRDEMIDFSALFGTVPTDTVSDPVPPKCLDVLNLRSVPIGFKCRTTKGAIYERVVRDNFGEAWKGSDGLIWSDFVGKYSQYNADTTCETLGGALPSRADFARGEANGFREVLPNMKDRWFWGSAAHPYSSAADGFDGDSGSIGADSRYYKCSVRCVGR